MKELKFRSKLCFIGEGESSIAVFICVVSDALKLLAKGISRSSSGDLFQARGLKVVGRFFGRALSSVWGRWRFFVALCWLFFGSVLAGALLPKEASFFVEEPVFVVGDAWLAVFRIFFSNLVLSAFLMVTVSGLVFFAFSPAILVLRAIVWGELLSRSTAGAFLAAVPTLMVEGAAYVLACVAGIVLGLSWLRPRWVYGEEGLSRVEALKKAFRECLWLYVWVVLLLAVAAVIEVATLAAA